MTKNDPYSFQWKNLGDIEEGRPNLGNMMNVAVYRLMQYTLRDILAHRFSPEQCGDLFREAGELAGREFCRNVLDKTLPFNQFIAQLQQKLMDLKIGIF
ncbi:MAG: 4-vinyl reductase, partial [Desulfuromonadaceae bacterium]